MLHLRPQPRTTLPSRHGAVALEADQDFVPGLLSIHLRHRHTNLLSLCVAVAHPLYPHAQLPQICRRVDGELHTPAEHIIGLTSATVLDWPHNLRCIPIPWCLQRLRDQLQPHKPEYSLQNQKHAPWPPLYYRISLRGITFIRSGISVVRCTWLPFFTQDTVLPFAPQPSFLSVSGSFSPLWSATWLIPWQCRVPSKRSSPDSR
ncbi:hypothetical protein C8R44DRAFT_774284 [Mycena epipterygia]|nr:hypothetical protein C8R44DRAFT_808273 [Mycena epipterygia]KAJ7131017.1 hypothetical protein C8R44DRAFT_774284 [Mycena epipterygia]